MLYFRWWHLENRSIPNYSTKEWYNFYILFERNPSTILAYEQHREAVMKINRACNIVSTKITHRERKDAARFLRRAGVERDEIRSHGRWAEDVLGEAYLADDISFSSAFALAEFEQNEKYMIPREACAPSEDIQKRIFPWLDECLAASYERGQ